MVTVINHTDKKVLVGPKYFGLIVGKQVYQVSSQTAVTQFPVRYLGRDEGASGLFQFRILKNVVGQKLVLNSPDAEQQFVEITQYQPRKPNVQATPPPVSKSEAREVEKMREKLRKELEKQQKNKK